MKEVRETMAIFALLTGVGTCLLSLSIIFSLLFSQNMWMSILLIKLLLTSVSVMILSFTFAWILSDDVWSRKNLPTMERKRLFNLR